MSSFNTLERSLARFLSRYPLFKSVTKASYTRLIYFKSRKPYSYQSNYRVQSLTTDNLISFFGYYDKSPVNKAGLILVCATDGDSRRAPSVCQPVSLLVLGATGNLLTQISTRSYNWQQGCRAHWLNDDLFVFNDFDEQGQCYVSRLYSVELDKEIRTFSLPVQDSFGADFFISLNYRRLMALRPDYGYRNLPALNSQELDNLESDGLWRVDYKTGQIKLLISLADVCEIRRLDIFSKAFHKLNHVMISPDGSRFIFMHRYLVKKQRFDRLLMAEMHTGKIKILADEGMVSHCFWADQETVLGYLRGPGGKAAYWLINVDTGKYTQFGAGVLDKYGDGHPHVQGDWFVTDTYPDKARMQRLLLCNWKTGEVKEIGEFFHGFEFKGESRCDLHPRLSPDGKVVFFDSVYSGKRQLYKMELP